MEELVVNFVTGFSPLIIVQASLLLGRSAIELVVYIHPNGVYMTTSVIIFGVLFCLI